MTHNGGHALVEAVHAVYWNLYICAFLSNNAA